MNQRSASCTLHAANNSSHVSLSTFSSAIKASATISHVCVVQSLKSIEIKLTGFNFTCRFYDQNRIRNVYSSTKRRIQHVLDSQHLVHQSVETGQAFQQDNGLSGSQDYHGGKLVSQFLMHLHKTGANKIMLISVKIIVWHAVMSWANKRGNFVF
jgi:hypothetical protein